MKPRSIPKVFYSLLALCYFEVVLWSACLLYATASPHCSHEYLQRETGNLKAFTGCTKEQSPEFFDELALAISEHHRQLEHAWLQLQLNAQNGVAASLLHQPSPQSLRAFLLPAAQGLPAPFTGVQAID